jgi:hypothetical protein
VTSFPPLGEFGGGRPPGPCTHVPGCSWQRRRRCCAKAADCSAESGALAAGWAGAGTAAGFAAAVGRAPAACRVALTGFGATDSVPLTCFAATDGVGSMALSGVADALPATKRSKHAAAPANVGKVQSFMNTSTASTRCGNRKSSGGEGEIRTHGRIAPTPVFKTGAFNRSATSPQRKQFYLTRTRCGHYPQP